LVSSANFSFVYFQQALEESNSKVQSVNEEYETLKGRVKVVAGELKDRRVESRDLQTKVDIMEKANEGLQDRITHLQAQGMDMNQNQSVTTQEMFSLRARVVELEAESTNAQKAMEEVKSKGEEALAAYKKKAQNSLSVGNARTASAVQAKEEAEMEARAARSTADSAMERALKAEANGREALAEARSYVKEMQAEVVNLDKIKDELTSAKEELKKAQAIADESKLSSDTLGAQVQTLASQLQAEQERLSLTETDLTGSQDRSNELLDEIERLRRESKKTKDDLKRVTAEKKNLVENSEKSSNGFASAITTSTSTSSLPKNSMENAEAESTITMLRQELLDSNQAIKELKETLKATFIEMEELSAGGGGSETAASGMYMGGPSGASGGGGGGATDMPLFYAMEKQAELTQARNEIARLAGLVGDSESTKQEALEAVAEMGIQMEQTQARLKRIEQLGGGGGGVDDQASQSLSSPAPDTSGSVNLEYLKNVVLSYLNAKTVTERKFLLPVIGTVLCLTAEEKQKAMEALSKEDRVIDSVANSVLSFKWT
jgi:chromosome segregation ATPase